MLIDRSDFKGVVNISRHCEEDSAILDQFIEERENLDLPALLGFCLLTELQEKTLGLTEREALLNGGIYEVNGGKKRHFGVKRILIHYAFAAYIYRGGMVDTPFSFVQKTSMDSIPVPIEELRRLHDENRKMAYKYWVMTLDFLCANKTDYPCFDDCECPVCDRCGEKGCSDRKCDKSNDYVRKYRIATLSK